MMIEEAEKAVDKALRWTGRRESVRNMPDLAAEVETVIAEEKAAVTAYGLAVLDEAEALTKYETIHEAIEEMEATGKDVNPYELFSQWLDMKFPALRARISEEG